MPFHPGRAACSNYAVFGEIHPLVLQEYDIDEKVYAAQLDLERLFAGVDGKLTYTPIPEHPSVSRDLSLVCDNAVESGEVVGIIKASCKRHLESVEFFDIFDLGEGQKSLSYKMIFRKTDGTLTDEEVDKSIKQVLAKLEENNIKLRG